MILNRILIFNYQSLQNVQFDLQVDAPTVLVGINDSGKSVILKALGLLLNPAPQFAFQRDTSVKRDLSNTVLEKDFFEAALTNNSLPLLLYSGQEAVIMGKFVVEGTDLTEESTAGLSRQLLWAIEKSLDSIIWVAKVFNNSGGTSEAYLLCQDVESSDQGLQELWLKTSTELKSLRTKVGVTDDEVKNINRAGRFTNLEQIRPLYSRESLRSVWRKYAEFRKDIEFFPQYRYLGWEFSLDDLKKIASDAMKGIIDQHTSNVKKQANTEAQQAESEVNEELASYVPLLKEDVPTLTGFKTRLAYEVKPNVSDILLNKINADSDIHLDLQGEGVKRQIWFGLIRIAALQAAKSDKESRHQFFWCFDEPETHLYPAAQRRFFDAIKSLSSTSFQIVLSTHSTVFVDRTKLGSLNDVRLEKGYTRIGICSEVDDVFEALDIKNSDFLFYDKFLLVEGDTERVLIPHLFQLYTRKKLSELGIQLIILGGKEKRKQNRETLISILTDFRKVDGSILHLLDGDARFGDERIAGEGVAYVGKQDIEDSISPEIWVNFVKNVVPEIEITVKEIDDIIKTIPDNVELSREQKFYEKLKAKVHQKANNDTVKRKVEISFPSKGRKQAEILKSLISDVSHIPLDLQRAFDKLKET
jgi:putative ATP-dependent endonuclease of OLD family